MLYIHTRNPSGPGQIVPDPLAGCIQRLVALSSSKLADLDLDGHVLRGGIVGARRLGCDLHLDGVGALLRALLDLSNQLKGKPDKRPRRTPKHDSGACSEYSDFFDRTRVRYFNGPMTDFSDQAVTRYIDHITIYSDYMEITFKPDITVRINK